MSSAKDARAISTPTPAAVEIARADLTVAMANLELAEADLETSAFINAVVPAPRPVIGGQLCGLRHLARFEDRDWRLAA